VLMGGYMGVVILIQMPSGVDCPDRGRPPGFVI